CSTSVLPDETQPNISLIAPLGRISIFAFYSHTYCARGGCESKWKKGRGWKGGGGELAVWGDSPLSTLLCDCCLHYFPLQFLIWARPRRLYGSPLPPHCFAIRGGARDFHTLRPGSQWAHPILTCRVY